LHTCCETTRARELAILVKQAYLLSTTWTITIASDHSHPDDTENAALKKGAERWLRRTIVS
jgi:hypothetical protein